MGFAGSSFARSGLFLSLAAWGVAAGAGQPTGATPLGNPGAWVTTSDYPTATLRDGTQGTVVFRVKVDPQGKPVQCVIDQSSGTEELDTATCNLITARAHFSPATDARGRPIEGAYTNRVRWVLPHSKIEKRPIDFVQEYTFVVSPDGVNSDCRVLQQTGAVTGTTVDLCADVLARGGHLVRDGSGRPVRKRVTIKSIATGEITMTTTISDP